MHARLWTTQSCEHIPTKARAFTWARSEEGPLYGEKRWAAETVVHGLFMKTLTLRLSVLPVTCFTDSALSITSPGIAWKNPTQLPFTTYFALPFLPSQILLHYGTLRAALSAELRYTVSGSAVHVESPTGLHALTSSTASFLHHRLLKATRINAI